MKDLSLLSHGIKRENELMISLASETKNHTDINNLICCQKTKLRLTMHKQTKRLMKMGFQPEIDLDRRIKSTIREYRNLRSQGINS